MSAYRDHDQWVAPTTAQLTAILFGAGALLWRASHPALTTAVTVAAALSTASVTWRPGGLLNPENLIPANYILIAIVVGSMVRSRQESFRRIQERAARAEHAREQEAQRRVYEERLRIAP